MLSRLLAGLMSLVGVFFLGDGYFRMWVLWAPTPEDRRMARLELLSGLALLVAGIWIMWEALV